GQVEIRVEAPELPEDPPLDDDIAPSEPADTTPSEEDAERPDPPVEDAAGSLVWGTLTALSVGFAIFALVLTVLALSGLDRVCESASPSSPAATIAATHASWSDGSCSTITFGICHVAAALRTAVA